MPGDELGTIVVTIVLSRPPGGATFTGNTSFNDEVDLVAITGDILTQVDTPNSIFFQTTQDIFTVKDARIEFPSSPLDALFELEWGVLVTDAFLIP